MRLLAIILSITLVPTAGAASLDDLAWMAGHWKMEKDGGTNEELWMKPAGGVMLGLNRNVRPGKNASFEFLRIEERNGMIAYIAQPGGGPPTRFPLLSKDKTSVTFENPDHDFPQRITYRLDENGLCARIEGTTDGKQSAHEWCWESARQP